MICVGGYHQIKDMLSNRLEDLYVYGCNENEEYLCGEYANWGMFERYYGQPK